MKPLIEVCVYVPCGREIMTWKCYDKAISWHWDDGTNGLLGSRVWPSGPYPRPVGNYTTVYIFEIYHSFSLLVVLIYIYINIG